MTVEQGLVILGMAVALVWLGLFVIHHGDED